VSVEDDTRDDLEMLRREVEDLRDELSTTKYDVEQVKSRGQHRANPRATYSQDGPRQSAARAWLGSGRGVGGRHGGRGAEDNAPRDWLDATRDNTGGLAWLAHPYALRQSAWVYRVRRKVTRWIRRGVVWLLITGVAAVVWGKGSPWAPDTAALRCGTVSAAPAAPGTPAQPDPPKESVAVRTARVNGWLLHKLTGPPPNPKGTAKAAKAGGRAAIVAILAFRATAQGKKDPAVVTRYNTAYAKRKQVEAQNAAASCNPCPPAAGGGGTMTVGWTAPKGASPNGERITRAAAIAAGFTGAHLDEAMAVAWLESGFHAGATNPRSSAAGTWQIMRSAHANDPDIGRWADPYASARMAYRISRGGTNWGPWAVWPQAQRLLASRSAAGVQTVAAACGNTSTYRTGAGKPWGGYSNGRIPPSALAHPQSAPRHLLRPDAATAFDRLNTAYTTRFGHPLGVTDSYRSYAAQVNVKARKPGLAATPGTSDHGWGLALDVVVGGYGSTDYLWLRANAPRFGWDNPPWARPGGSKREPWHWEWQPTGGAA
jgi:ribosomal protein L19E